MSTSFPGSGAGVVKKSLVHTVGACANTSVVIVIIGGILWECDYNQERAVVASQRSQ